MTEYKTKPYFKLGIPSPWEPVTYFVNKKEASIRRRFRSGPIDAIRLPATRIQLRQSFVESLFGLGSVVVHDAGGNALTFEKVRNVKRFQRALHGQFSQPELSPGVEIRDVETTLLKFPALPTAIDVSLWRMFNTLQNCFWARPGTFVEKDAVLFDIKIRGGRNVKVLSPVSAYVIHCEPRCIREGWLVLLPVKGQEIPSHIGDLFRPFIDVLQAEHPKTVRYIPPDYRYSRSAIEIDSVSEQAYKLEEISKEHTELLRDLSKHVPSIRDVLSNVDSG